MENLLIGVGVKKMRQSPGFFDEGGGKAMQDLGWCAWTWRPILVPSRLTLGFTF